MPTALTPLHLVELVGAGAVLLVGAYAWQHRSQPGARPLVVITIGAVVWITTDVVRNLYVMGPPTRYLAILFYFGVSTTVAGWGAFAIEFSGYRSHVSRRTAALLTVEPVVTTLLVTTNPLHQLWFTGDITARAFPGLGIAYWLHAGYAYVLVVGGIGLLLLMLSRKQTLYPRQVYLAVLGVLLPWFADLAWVFGIVEADYHALALTGTAVLLSLSLFRHKFLRLAPTAQRPLFDNLRDGVFVIDLDGRVTNVNPAAREVLWADLEGTDAREYFGGHPEFGPHLETLLSTTEEATFEVELGDRYYDVQVTPLQDHRGELLARQVQLHDITTQRRREQELARQNERLDRFAAVLSHDLRNPLSVASDRAALALETGDLSHVESVVEKLDRMEQIIDDVLTLAREGETVEETEAVALDEVVSAAWSNVDTADAALRVETERQVVADPVRLSRLFENLFRNSVDHAGPGVTVTVADHDEGRFYVADDGPGIPSEKRDEIFEAGTSERSTGLGLTIVRSIAAAHGWDVAVTESESGGARFDFSVDDATSSAPSRAETSAAN